jgi:4-amino-4-deoxy-L-arabinose transferase-like glycosyltransferase
MKLPGTYAAYAAIMAVFGQTTAGIHLGLILVNSACIFLAFVIARRLIDPTAGVVAGAIFGLFTIRPLLTGLASHATHFVALMVLVSLYLLLKAVETKRLAIFFWSGIFSGLALVMKQPGLFFGIFSALYLIWSEWPGWSARGPLLRKFGAFSSGAILPYALTCLILLRAGVFQKFWFWTVSYARAYGSELTASKGLHQFANRMELQKEHLGLIWFLIVFGVVAMFWDSKLRRNAVFFLGLLAFSFLAISVGFYYRGHYFIMAYPILAMLTGAGVSALREVLNRLRVPAFAAALPVVLFSLAFANALYADRKTYFFDTPHEACRYVYGSNPFPEALGVADYIRKHSAADARVAVLGSEPEIYFYAHRFSATGYIYTYALVEEQQYGAVMQAEMIKEVESAKPEFLVHVLMHESWNTREHAETRIFDWLESYIPDHYTLVGVADGGNHDVYRWGEDAATYRSRRPERVLVFRRTP